MLELSRRWQDRLLVLSYLQLLQPASDPSPSLSLDLPQATLTLSSHNSLTCNLSSAHLSAYPSLFDFHPSMLPLLKPIGGCTTIRGEFGPPGTLRRRLYTAASSQSENQKAGERCPSFSPCSLFSSDARRGDAPVDFHRRTASPPPGRKPFAFAVGARSCLVTPLACPLKSPLSPETGVSC